MSKSPNRSRIIAIILLSAFVLWLVLTVFPIGGAKDKVRNASPSAKENTYEPKFKKEGELTFLQPETNDTLKAIDIEFADTPEKIQYGMMYRKSMDENTGMLFLMGQQRRQSFWMKNTYVSLDIIFINDKGEVVSIQKNAEPLSESSLPSEGPASMVLEVKAGFSDTYGITKNTKVIFKRN